MVRFNERFSHRELQRDFDGTKPGRLRPQNSISGGSCSLHPIAPAQKCLNKSLLGTQPVPGTRARSSRTLVISRCASSNRSSAISALAVVSARARVVLTLEKRSCCALRTCSCASLNRPDETYKHARFARAATLPLDQPISVAAIAPRCASSVAPPISPMSHNQPIRRHQSMH